MIAAAFLQAPVPWNLDIEKISLVVISIDRDPFRKLRPDQDVVLADHTLIGDAVPFLGQPGEELSCPLKRVFSGKCPTSVPFPNSRYQTFRFPLFIFIKYYLSDILNNRAHNISRSWNFLSPSHQAGKEFETQSSVFNNSRNRSDIYVPILICHQISVGQGRKNRNFPSSRVSLQDHILVQHRLG
jgi:hypothetical protein